MGRLEEFSPVLFLRTKKNSGGAATRQARIAKLKAAQIGDSAVGRPGRRSFFKPMLLITHNSVAYVECAGAIEEQAQMLKRIFRPTQTASPVCPVIVDKNSGEVSETNSIQFWPRWPARSSLGEPTLQSGRS